jgi:hypothetical protein
VPIDAKQEQAFHQVRWLPIPKFVHCQLLIILLSIILCRKPTGLREESATNFLDFTAYFFSSILQQSFLLQPCLCSFGPKKFVTPLLLL